MLSKLGERIRTMRKKMLLSQDDLSGLLNVSRQTISKWETQEFLPDVHNLMKLAKVYNITVDELLMGSSLSKYSSGILTNDLKVNYTKTLRNGVIYLISAGVVFIISLIIILLYIESENLFNLLLWISLIIFAVLFSLGIRMFYRSYILKKEYSYLERLEVEKNKNNKK